MPTATAERSSVNFDAEAKLQPGSPTVALRIPEPWNSFIGDVAEHLGTTKTEYIREAIKEKLLRDFTTE